MDMLRLLSEVQDALEASGTAPENAGAIIGPTEADDDEVVRVSLHVKATDAVIGTADKLLGRSETVESAVADIADSLASVGVQDLRIARKFDEEGVPGGVRPYARR
jgi:hypothetical protein